MPSIYELILPDINESTTLKARAEICLGLRKTGWTAQQAEAATGLEWTFDEGSGDSVRIVELVPRPGRVQ